MYSCEIFIQQTATNTNAKKDTSNVKNKKMYTKSKKNNTDTNINYIFAIQN